MAGLETVAVAAKTDVAPHEIEASTRSVASLLEDSQRIYSRLSTLRSRLLGMDTSATEDEKAAQPVRSEIAELNYQIHQTNAVLIDVAGLVGDLETL